eukprot:CAMPEP_0116986922 /NCGR_PEP_ID=MMETSP0467-20121206/63188_1 /TAXON_ID=283647 /ORGANISM="Mesodinium pulex, Strain SPMC105" /LENGTH=43 /DNA_ID= /DNA_START= /DNA_END= /DNA_ORIENTATION=
MEYLEKTKGLDSNFIIQTKNYKFGNLGNSDGNGGGNGGGEGKV